MSNIEPRSRFSRVRNVTPAQESMSEIFVEVINYWERYRSGQLLSGLSIKFIFQYLLLLYILPQFVNWIGSLSNSYGYLFSIIFRVFTCVGLLFVPRELYIPNKFFYRKSSHGNYSYIEQVICLIVYVVTRIFTMEYFTFSSGINRHVSSDIIYNTNNSSSNTISGMNNTINGVNNIISNTINMNLKTHMGPDVSNNIVIILCGIFWCLWAQQYGCVLG